MTKLTIRESVEEELVSINSVVKGSLKHRLGERIRDVEKIQRLEMQPKESGELSGAEQAVLESGLSLEVSWAVTPTPFAHKAALVLAYEEQHGARPGFVRTDTGKWVQGVIQLVLKHGEAYEDLTWSDWAPMNEATSSHIPDELGVYRVRIARSQT